MTPRTEISDLRMNSDLIDGAPRVPNNSPVDSSFSDSNSDLETPDTLSLTSLSIEDGFPRVFVVGISGPSSSGKTTLASILTKIFEVAALKEGKEIETAITMDKSGKIKLDDEFAASKPVICLHQDCYFVHDKGLCPFGTFYTHDNDYAFVMKTRQGDDFGQYFWESDGTRPLREHYDGPIPEPDGKLRPKLIDAWFPGRARSLDYLKFEGGKALRKKVTGPDTDCDQAVRFSALLQDLIKVRSGTKPEYPKVSGSGQKRDCHSEAEFQASMSAKVVAHYDDLIQEMKERVASVFQGNERYTSFCIVDGFLLFTDPAKKIDTFELEETNSKEMLAQNYIRRLGELMGDVEKYEDAACPELEQERNDNEAKLLDISAQAKVAMQSLFDVKLFLPASKNVIKKRRFARPEYIDFPDGLRLPGQMWKTEGYFDEKVWSNYLKAHDWLIDEDGKAKGAEGIQVRPIVDAGIGFTVRWAVDSILVQMRYSVGTDPKKRTCCGEGCCDKLPSLGF